MDPNGFRTLYTRRLWEQFTEGKPIAPDSLPDYVYRSWVLCRENGLTPKDLPEPKRLAPEELEALQAEHHELLEIAKPVLNMILLSTSDTQPIVILTSARGVILHVIGSEESLSVQETFYNTPGVVCDDKTLGVRATTLALHEKQPISLCGSEHYLEIFHESLCYAAPVHDHTGEIIASISIATSLKKYHPHTMAMLTAAAENISMQMQKKDLDKKKGYLSSLVYSICNVLPEGIVALDMKNTIVYVNHAAEEIFNLASHDLVGKPVTDFIHKASMEELAQSISSRKQNNIPILIKDKSVENKYLCRIQPLTQGAREQIGMTLFLASDEQILKGITQVGGNRAYYHLDDILGESPQMKQCIKLAQKIARKATRILITGESGTGKELFAQALHNAGPRRSGPFVAISCASIPRELVEAELFGYVSGSFTGASKGGAVGKFELAQNGTLFLDEINSLPLEAQGKLLRALQQNEIVRVGGKAPVPVNAHVISATNVSLPELVGARMFREDLLYRLNSVEIHIPALRERPGDIEILIRHFVNAYAKSQKRQITISQTWLDAMLEHTWTGNVRELENACEYALIVCEGNTLQLRHIPSSLMDVGSMQDAGPRTIQCDHVDDAYKKWLCKALESCNSNITAAADKFGISRSTLYRKIKRYGLESESFRAHDESN